MCGPGGGHLGAPSGPRVPCQRRQQALTDGRIVRFDRSELAVVTTQERAELDEAMGVVDQFDDAQQAVQQSVPLTSMSTGKRSRTCG